ncbi:MAG: PD-(D/E)XK nuclease family transposase [Eubacterium sp.]|nr:PD-(D/E)XK nuclease family transposase [Eubacterium sp.]
MIFNEKMGDLMDMENQMELKRKETLEAIDKLCLLDDNLMILAFDRNIEAAELLLNVILQRNDLKVLEVMAQREYKNPMSGGRSITIDIYAMDEDGKVYDIEVQRESTGADVHRARFHSSMIDTKMLKTQQNFKEIHDSYVIFITERDVLGAGFSLYHINRVVEETGVYFGDGSHIIYVNGSYKDDNDPVGKLMHDFRCVSSVDMFYPELAEQVKFFKETKGGREIMCQVFEDLAEKRVLDEKANLIKNLMETMKWTAEQAMEAMKISETDKKLLVKEEDFL